MISEGVSNRGQKYPTHGGTLLHVRIKNIWWDFAHVGSLNIEKTQYESRDILLAISICEEDLVEISITNICNEATPY